MSDSKHNPIAVVSDEEILSHVQHLMHDTINTRMSHRHMRVRVTDGIVIMSGHLASEIGYDLLIDNIAAIDGVIAVDDTELFVDNDLRQQIITLLPRGVRVSVQHGAVALSGRPSTKFDLKELIGCIGELRGVVMVNTDSLHV